MESSYNQIGNEMPAEKCNFKWNVYNAEIITTHIASFESILRDYEMDSLRFINLDETVVKLNRYTCKPLSHKVVLRSGKLF